MAPLVTQEEITGRVENFQQSLEEEGVDGALLVQKMDVYYLAGTDQDAHLWVPVSGAPLLMVRKSLQRAKEDSCIKEIIALKGFSALPGLIRDHTRRKIQRLGLEMDVLPASFYTTYQGLFPDAEMVDISHLVRGLRMVKSGYEIDCICRAAEMADRMFEQTAFFVRESRDETDLALKIEAFYRGLGHPGLVRARAFNTECFYGHVLAGKSAAISSNSPGPTGGTGLGPFYSQGAGRGEILPKEPVMVDYTSNVQGYVADQARIYSIGPLDDRLRRAHDCMLKVQRFLCERGRPGARAGDLYAAVLKIVEKEGLADGFMGSPDPVPFVAHGVGLELDEWPIIGRGSDSMLEKGMVVAMEPKMVFPGRGVVGIENTLVVTDKGLQKFGRFPDEICVVTI